ncbi:MULTISPECIES: pentapeptide repeat-containing protein [Cyanophyceae]|uniref:Pentapeptide repeat-containing protein n=1 Tax=Stenomitos frigidus AS-A4 TaxID=2933935 RepID=A0ABV0KFM8_9CYAN
MQYRDCHPASKVNMQVQDLLERYQNGERNFAQIDLSSANLSGVNLRDADLTGANLTGANLSWAFLSRANLTGACLRRADLRSASLNNAVLNQTILSGANLGKADLRMAQLEAADLSWAVLQEADLSGANLQAAKLDQVNLERAKLSNSCLAAAELMEANLRRANLTSATLDRANLREAHLEEANLREASLIGANLIEANLNGVYLRQANLTEADLHRVVLTGADMSEAILTNADLSRSNLAGAYLLKASMSKAQLLRANLQDVYLLRADLNGANLRGADLRRADLSGAYLSDTSLSEADLSDAYLLESHLIRTNLDGAQMTGCCIANWHLENTDCSRINCRYVFTGFDYTTKSPADRYPVGRDLEAGELERHYQQDNAVVEVYLTEPPNWEALAFTLAQLDLEENALGLTIKAYKPSDDNYLIQLKATRPVNAKALTRRIFQVYPKILQQLLTHRTEILSLLAIAPQTKQSDVALEPASQVNRAAPEVPSHDRRIRLYQEVVRQIQHIMMNQAPDQFVQSVQQLLDYLNHQGIATEAIQKKVISQVITQRAKQDKSFCDHIQRWEKTAPDVARSSAVGQAMRFAIAQMWADTKQN